MPVWHQRTKKARDSGKLAVVGVTQEQHADRCRLVAQWKGLEWPILHDPINLLKPRAVPIFVAIDEAGVVVDSNLRDDEFETFLAQPANPSVQPNPVTAATARSLDRQARESNRAVDWLAAGDHRILWGGTARATAAIERYAKALEMVPNDSSALFRLGVAYRMRYDSPAGRGDDFQLAVDAWGRALDADPNHYIYRRRIQQYGPRLTKPYPFYDWIHQAREEIIARGDKPLDLDVEPVGAEIAAPSKRIRGDATVPEPLDPGGNIRRDDENFIEATVSVVPGRITPGEAVRVHVLLRPSRQAHWNNEAEPLKIWIEVPSGWEAESPLLETAQGSEPESDEPRSVDFELRSPTNTSIRTIKAYALYYVCEEQGGRCLYRRKDIEIPIRFRR